MTVDDQGDRAARANRRPRRSRSPIPRRAASGSGPTGALDRAAAPAVVNANDEYALEAALKLAEAHGGEVTLAVDGAGAGAPETIAQGAGDGRGAAASS